MQKRVLALMMVCIFTLGLMLTPAKTIFAEPVIRVVSNSSQYLDYFIKNISSNGANNENLLNPNNNSLPLLTFPNGDSTTIPRYIDTNAKATDTPEIGSDNKAEPSKLPVIISPDSQNQPVITVKPASEADIPAQAVTAKKVEQETVMPKKTDQEATNKKPDLPQVKAFREIYNDSPAHALVGRAIWYMNYGYMVYGHKKYWDTGYIDCSNFVSLVYKDFGYTITSAARKYNTVGKPISGVYSKLQPGSTKKYMLARIDKLKPGDILTFWKEDSKGERYISHVALYMGKLNGKPTVIHTVKGYPTAIGITTSFTYWYGEHFNGARRVLGTSAYSSKTAYSDKKPVIPAKYQMTPGPVIMPGYLPSGF